VRLRALAVTTTTTAVLVSLIVPPAVAEGPAGAAPAVDPAGEPAPTTVSERVESLPAGGAPSAKAQATGLEVSAPFEAPLPFSMVGLDLPEAASARLRTSPDGATWSEWHEAEALEPDDAPDPGTPEAAGAVPSSRFTEPLWVGEARWLQVEVAGAPATAVGATFIDSDGLSDRAVPLPAAAPAPAGAKSYSAGRPGITSRAGWGANESLRQGSPAYAPAARFAVVHHTAGGNGYSAANGPAVVRGIYHYHTQTLGWSDIGYNLLVDRFGRIYEGRAGGLDRAVVGAHAQGFNTHSIGIAVLGEFTRSAPPQAAQNAVAAVLAWKMRLHGFSPSGTLSVTSAGSNKYPAGRNVQLPRVIGHRDVGQTACPGTAFYNRLGALRAAVLWKWTQLPSASAARPASAGSFSDIGGNVHADAIRRLAARGVVSGCGGGRYCPNMPVTRGQAAAMIVRSLGIPPGSRQRFRDVPMSHPHAVAIAAAVDRGFITGMPNGTFRPDAPLTREQMATVLARAARLARVAGQHFRDVPWTSPHLAYVNAIGRARISNGCGNRNYCPAHRVTRAQMASFVVRGLL
jgi:hypothetical protein